MMRVSIWAFIALTASFACSFSVAISAGETAAYMIDIPARNVRVSLPDGMITTKGIADPCLETVTWAGNHELIVTRKVGDDQARVFLDGQRLDFSVNDTGMARIGSIRLARDGSTVHVRTWKSGTRNIELLQNNAVRMAWPAGTAVRPIRYDRRSLTLLVRKQHANAELLRFYRDDDGAINTVGKNLFTFEKCAPGTIRPIRGGFLVHLPCRNGEAALHFLDPKTGILSPVLKSGTAVSFPPIRKTGSLKKRIAVVSVEGSSSAINFYHAVTGLLLGQTGEPKSCASDAEGLQSWNQSYRLLALSELYRKTGEPVFAGLAAKSMENTLGAVNSAIGRTKGPNPECAWSSLIYSAKPNRPLSLLVNQAVIGNALSQGCSILGSQCGQARKQKIAALKQCLTESYEPDFDPGSGLYRIQKDAAFRFAGELAPWNWQISFAALIAGTESPNVDYSSRAKRITEQFLSEFEGTDDGALWRYWPHAYYTESGLSAEAISKKRYEDTSHAGISLMSLVHFEAGRSSLVHTTVARRLDTIINAGPEPARDLDGRGPRSPRWFPAIGWAEFAGTSYAARFAQGAAGSRSAKALYTHARLFEPDAEFKLKIRIFACDNACVEWKREDYSSPSSFLFDNPMFQITSLNVNR